MKIKASDGQVILQIPEEQQLRRLAALLPLAGPIPEKPGGADYGIVMQHGSQETWAIKQQPVDMKESHADEVAMANQSLVVQAIPRYMKRGFKGVLMPCVYSREQDWPVGLYRRADSFRFRRMAGGKVVMQIWGEIPLSDAIRKTHRYNLDIEDGLDPVDKAKKDETTFSVFSGEWLGLKATGVRGKSIVRYKAIVNNFGRFLGERKRGEDVVLSEVSAEDASAYVQWRAVTPIMPNGHMQLTAAVRQGAARKTIHEETNMLRQLFKAAVRRKILVANPFDEIRVAKPKRHEVAAKHHPLTETEENAFLQAAGGLDAERNYGEGSLRDVYLFMLKTGLRENELRYLEWGDIDWDHGLIRIRDKVVVEIRTVDIPGSAISGLRRLMAGRPPESLLFKNEAEKGRFHCVLPIRESRTLGAIKVADVDLQARRIVATRQYEWRPKATQGDVPMCQAVRDMLLRLKAAKKSNFVFAHKDGGSCRLQLWEMVKECQKRAKIPGNLRLHDLRHTFAVRLRQRGTPLEVIMGLMRHSDIRETLIYAPYDLAEGRNAIQVLDR